ncbi:MAG: hypothetical protein F2754_03255 [Actinobacteria bacterium]|nr:hypothetical protein [Actinomycetota bacterium]
MGTWAEAQIGIYPVGFAFFLMSSPRGLNADVSLLLPCFIRIERALRDEGTSVHYVAPS